MAVSGRSVAEIKGFHQYIPPTLEELIYKAENIRSEYTGKNSDRLELITLLELVHVYIEKLNTNNKVYSKSELQDISMGCWIFCFENIAQDYRLLEPKFEFGSIFNSGSKLYQLIMTELNIDKYHQISEQKKLNWLNKFHKFIYKTEIENELAETALAVQEDINSNRFKLNLKDQLIQVMKEVLDRENHTEKRVLKAIPYERSIDNKIMQLLIEYKRRSKKQNPNRLFLIHLAIAICKNNPQTDNKDDVNLGLFLSRTQRIKMGVLIYIMQSIADTYRIPMLRAAKGHSTLYDLCDEALVNCFSYLNDATKMACLSAFESYINDEKNRSILEKDINKQILEHEYRLRYLFIDPEINFISKHAEEMMRRLTPPTGISKVTLAMTGVGALIGSAPGYGTGYGVGFGFSMMDQASHCKQSISGFTSLAMAVIFDGGEYFGYYSADILINATLERFFAKIFEAIGALTFAAGFGMMSFVIYDLSYQTACNLCQLYLHLSKNMDPALLSQTDLVFVNTLLELPESVFSDSKKEKLRNITDTSAKVSEFSLLSQRMSSEEKSIAEENSRSLLMTPSTLIY